MKKAEGVGMGDGTMWFNNTGVSVGLIPFRRTLGTLGLLLTTPVIPLFLWWTIQRNGGSLQVAYSRIRLEGSDLFSELPFPFSSSKAATILGIFCMLALVLTRVLPCEMYIGPPSPTGYRNSYHANGLSYYLVMNTLFVGGSQFGLGLYNGGILFDHYGHLLSLLTVCAFVFCIVLFIKGITFPSSRDCGTSGNLLFDFFYGTELYPNILGWDVKQFTNDRFGLMFWCLACLSFVSKQYELNGRVSEAMFVSVSLQWVYLLKFFIWETGYFNTMDIQHDRAGYYICWGCLVWVPSVYTCSSHWLVEHPIRLSSLSTVTFIFVGVTAIWVNYEADRQRTSFRRSNGKCKIWGREPKKIVAEYRTEKGNKKSNLLLASGWWGQARHFHYFPELVAAFTWSPPCTDYFLPYFYTAFLAILLLDRAYRDDARCFSKYGDAWLQYCKMVPYRIIPYIL